MSGIQLHLNTVLERYTTCSKRSLHISIQFYNYSSHTTCIETTPQANETTPTLLEMEEVGSNGAVWSGWREARKTLRKYRESRARKSSHVILLGTRLLQNHSGSLGDEKWTVHEQLCTAALDCGDMDTAQTSLEVLQRQFGDGSSRVVRLQGLCLEATEEFDEALKLYEQVLEATPTNAAICKRKVAVYKAQGRSVDAIKELTSLLEVFQSDSEAWLELADLYIKHNNYAKAAFCMEELILANPHDHLYHQRYAEICYTQDAMETARKHYATCLKLNPDNIRALYGFCWVCGALSRGKGRAELKTKNSRYCDWARSQLKQKYQFDSEKLRIVERMLDTVCGK